MRTSRAVPDYGTLQAATVALEVSGTHSRALTESHLRRDAHYGTRPCAAGFNYTSVATFVIRTPSDGISSVARWTG